MCVCVHVYVCVCVCVCVLCVCVRACGGDVDVYITSRGRCYLSAESRAE